MKKNVFGRKLKRDKNERTALFKSLMSALILNESIKTTEAKAKAIRPQIEKLVTKAKTAEKGSLQVLEKNLSKQAFDKIVKEIGPRFVKRAGGYTRIIKLGERFGDNSPFVLMEWVEKAPVDQVAAPVKKEKKTLLKKDKKAVKRPVAKVKDGKKTSAKKQSKKAK